MVLAGAFFAVGAYQPAFFRVNLPGVMLGLMSAGFFASYIPRASTLARRLNAWTVQLLQVFGTAVIVAGVIIVQATSSDAAITAAPIQ